MGRLRPQIRDDARAPGDGVLVRARRRQDRRGVDKPYGFVGVNAAGLPYATDGMNEAGLTVGALFFPGFAKYQEVKADELATTVSNVDLVNYILSNFKTVDEVRAAMPKIRVVRNAEIEKEFGTPLPLHHIVSDASGASIVIEYVDGKLAMTDNKVGAMTNSPNYSTGTSSTYATMRT